MILLWLVVLIVCIVAEIATMGLITIWFAGGSLIGVLAAALGDDPASWPYRNDFLPVFLADGERGGIYRDILEGLKTQGADFSGLSGAGATCFGVFSRQGAAEAAVRVLEKRWNFVCLTFFLARSAGSVLQ